MNTSLLIRLISIGKTGFQAFVVTSLTILKLMVLVVMILARRVDSDGIDDSWFGGSSNTMSWQEHFSVLEIRTEISMDCTIVGGERNRGEECGCDRVSEVKGCDDGGKGSETSSGKRGKGRLYHNSTESKRTISIDSKKLVKNVLRDLFICNVDITNDMIQDPRVICYGDL